METLNETGEMVLILGRFELSRKGAGGQDALGQAHAVMSVHATVISSLQVC